MSTNSEPILRRGVAPDSATRHLFTCAATRTLEVAAASGLPTHALMERAGLALARFVLAIAPHAQRVWIACGPGNNGGDGFEAAWHLKQWGKDPVVTCLPGAGGTPADARAARQKAAQANVTFAEQIPTRYEVCVDALFGIGPLRRFDDQGTALVAHINASTVPVISVDLPSGLDGDTGACGEVCVKADHTLCLLTLKPGLFTAHGREACGDIWFNALEIPAPEDACAQLNPRPAPRARAHDTHKGSFGDVGVLGGAPGMAGAALLAATAALYGGAGRTYVALLDPQQHPPLDVTQPELMFRTPAELALESMTVVAGCGGGLHMGAHLEALIARAKHLVLDADALNTIAQHPDLGQHIAQRKPNTTVLTPHPLEAARLLGTDSTQIQAHRLQAAQSLAERFTCTVVLKGSGTVIAAPGMRARINTTGNARLATAGTGDVLAGLIGACLAAGMDGFGASSEAVFRHGQVADEWPVGTTLTAQGLARAL